MNGVMRPVVWVVLALAVAAGCKVSVETDPEAVQKAQQAGEVAKEAASQAAERVREGAERGVDSASKATTQGMNTAAIRAALANRRDLSTKDVTIETIEKTVYMRGSVPTQRDRFWVEEVARAVAGPDYDLMNELQVGRAP